MQLVTRYCSVTCSASPHNEDLGARLRVLINTLGEGIEVTEPATASTVASGTL